MVVAVVILAILLVAVGVLLIVKRDMFTSIFGGSITRMVEKQKKINGEIEVLKKQQKVKSEEVIKEAATKKKALSDAVEANIQALQAQISSLKEQKKTKTALIDESTKVELDKVINDFDQKIVAKKNQSKRLTHLIGAEKMNMEDILSPELPNAPQPINPMGFAGQEKESKKSSK